MLIYNTNIYSRWNNVHVLPFVGCLSGISVGPVCRGMLISMDTNFAKVKIHHSTHAWTILQLCVKEQKCLFGILQEYFIMAKYQCSFYGRGCSTTPVVIWQAGFFFSYLASSRFLFAVLSQWLFIPSDVLFQKNPWKSLIKKFKMHD